MTAEQATQVHPHGRQMNILNIIDEGGNKQFSTDNINIDEIFLHPEVKDRKLIVLSVIGAYRKGKSFFLDYCLRFLYANYRSVSNMEESKPISGDWMGDGNTPLQGFSWTHGSTADTKGMKMWSDVFLHDTPTEKIAIIVMDTQGLFETGSTREENGRIFGLSTLISSIQILNLNGVLQEDQLEYLETATSLAKIIAKKQKSTQWKPFQRLLFLFRDWTDESIGFGYEGGRKYLNKAILKVAGNEDSKANVIRQNIRSSFDQISCFLLDNPGKMITKGLGEWSILDEDFVGNLKILIESLLLPENLIKKTTLGKDLTAKEFQDLIKIYFNAFANAKLPDTENILQLAIDNQMQTIVNAQLKVFNQLQADLDIDFDRENFVEWVEEVRENNTKTAVDGFLKAEKLDDEESSMKFEEILRNETEVLFKNWKQTTMKAYDDFQEQKRLREIENCFNLQVSNYQEIMNKDIDFNQDDFEKYYEDLNKSTVENSSQELEKMRFKDDESEKAVTSLMDKLNEFYETLSSSKTQEYKNHLNFVKLLAETQFETYKSLLCQNVGYENEEDFESYLHQKHLSARTTSIERFDNTELAFTPRKAQFEEELVTKIDIEYQTWKEATMKIYEDLQDKKNQREIERCIDVQVESYQKIMSNNLDFNKDDFETYYQDLHNSIVVNAIVELEKLKFKDEASKTLTMKSLEEKLSECFPILKTNKLAEFNKHLNFISMIADTQFEIYKSILCQDVNYKNQTDFESYLEEKNFRARNTSINEFNRTELEFKPRKEQLKEDLVTKIDKEYQTWKEAAMKIYEDLQDKKNRKEVKRSIILQVRSYQDIMSNNLDFNQDDFEAYYEDLHNSTVANAVKELEKLKFKDEATKLNSTKSLETELTKVFVKLNASKSAEYNQHLKNIVIFMDSQFDAYKIDLNRDIEYENQPDFVKYIDEKHASAKKEALDKFEKAHQLTFTPKKAQFKEELIEKIEKEYQICKKTVMKEHGKLQNQKNDTEIEKCFNLQVKSYQKTMRTNLDFDQDDFKKYYEKLHKSTMKNAVKELEKMDFKNKETKENEIKKLKERLDEHYEEFSGSKITEYNKYLKEVSSLVDTQFEAYKKSLNLNFNYENHTNFNGYINEKHSEAKRAAIDGFLNSKQLTYTPRKDKFKEELNAKINSEGLTWKDEMMKNYQSRQNETRQIEIEKNIKVLYKNYQHTMENLDYNQEDFEKYFKHLHKSSTERAIEELEKLTFKDEASKLNAISTLEDKLNDHFNTIRTSNVSTYNQRLKTVSMYTDMQFETYKNNLNWNLDYNQTDFEKYIDEKHSSAKVATLKSFENSQQVLNAPRKDHFKEKLTENMDSEFQTWRIPIMEKYLKNRSDIKEIFQLKIDSYKSSLDLDIDFKRKNFINSLTSRHEIKKEKLARDFIEDTNFLNIVATQIKLKSQLAVELDNIFKEWFEDTKAEYKELIEKNQVNTTHDKILQNCKDAIEEISFDDVNYLSLINAKHLMAISKFKSETRKISDRECVNDKIVLLTNALEEFKKQKVQIYQELRTTGIWVPWSGSMSGVPKYAVEGGFDGVTLYYARAKIDGNLHIGMFAIGAPEASILYERRKKTFPSFEIFTHTNYKFVWKNKDETFIVGGYDSNGSVIHLCRTSNGYFSNSNKMIPGKLIGSTGYIMINNVEDTFNFHYRTLVLAAKP